MQRPSFDELSGGRPKSYTITVSSPGSEGSGFPSIDGVSPNQENLHILESFTSQSPAEEDKNTGKTTQGKGV